MLGHFCSCELNKIVKERAKETLQARGNDSMPFADSTLASISSLI